MLNDKRSAGLVMFAVIIFSFILLSSSFADTIKYSYDNLNRLIRIEYGDGTITEYNYDEVGNRTGNIQNYTITATAGSNGSISPSGSVVVQKGNSQSFSITPVTGYRIADVKVNGASIGAVSTYTFSDVLTNHTIDAQFAWGMLLNVSLNNPAGGVVTSSPAGINCGSTCSAVFGQNTSVTLTAAPNIAYNFTGWSGACTGTGTCALTMDSGKDVTANFSIKQFTITASAEPIGSITPSGAVVLDYGSSQTFTITPSAGASINTVTVDGSSVGAVSTYTFNNVTANHTISAAFNCPNLPVRISGSTPTYYSTLQAAYNAAANGSIIQVQAKGFTENLNINRNIPVSINGGYSCNYSTITANTTPVKGQLRTFTNGGTLTIKNINLTQ